MQEIKATFQQKIVRTSSVASFRFVLGQGLTFSPGQFLQIIFDPEQRDNKEMNKYLSFSSAPDKPYIEVTKRLSQSRFSQKLNNLLPEEQVLIKAPLGSCVFKEEYQRVAFLIGGIGITPVISIVEFASERKLSNDIILLYSNRDEEEIAFKKELDAWQGQNPQFRVFYTLTDCQPKDKSCVFGRIDKNLLLGRVPDYKERVIFIFGPPGMVQAMSDLCLEAGCKKENIKSENFIGY